MAKVIQKKNHWITKVNECTLVPDASGELNVELLGGAENGEFPYVGHVREELVLFQDGQLCEGELLLEVDGLAVPGLPLYDIFALIKCCNGPVRMRTVRQGKTRPCMCVRALRFTHQVSETLCGSSFRIAMWRNSNPK